MARPPLGVYFSLDRQYGKWLLCISEQSTHFSFFSVFHWSHIIQGFMRPIFIAILHPFISQKSHILYCSEDICIQYCSAITAVEPFYYAILGGVTRLDVNHIDFIPLAPFLKYLGDKLRTIIASYILGLPLSHITFSSNFITRSAGIDMGISWPTATLSQSSIIFSTLKVLPL